MHVRSDGVDDRSKGLNVVAGKPHKAIDQGGTYKKACALLARDLGWGVGEVFSIWREVAMIHEFEQGWPRACAEWQAMHDVRAMLFKPGQGGD